MDATLSCRLLSKGNWKAIVNTDRVLWNELKSPALWFVVEPTSRLEVRSNVRCVANASFESLCINNWKTLVCWEEGIAEQQSDIAQTQNPNINSGQAQKTQLFLIPKE